jgi:hypothetical protein
MRREPNEIDFWRGFALVTIFVNHIPGLYFERFTYRNLSLSDSAELFVFLAGWSLRLMVEGPGAGMPMRSLVPRLYGRALTVYFAQLVITEMAVAILAGASIIYNAPFLLQIHNVSAVFQDPVRAHVGVVLMTHQLGYFNILPLYVALMFVAPLIAIGSHYCRWLLLPLSLGIYLLTLAKGINLPTWPVAGTWFLNPLAWQFIYVLGFLLAGKDGLGAWARRHRRVLFLFALPIVALGVLIALTRYSPNPADVPNLKLFFTFDKTFLSPARLIHMLALAAVFAGIFKPVRAWLPSVTAYCSLLGRNSLYVFCAASLFSLCGQIFRLANGGLLVTDTCLFVAGLAIMGGVAWLSDGRPRLRGAVPDSRVASSASP